MKITCFVLCVLGLAALATADSDFFVPKTFYKISNIVEISPHEANILNRLRRQTSSSGGATSSSSTTYSEDGGPTHFTSHQIVQQSPGFESRFGGESGYSGRATHTTGTIGKDGRVVYKTQNINL